MRKLLSFFTTITILTSTTTSLVSCSTIDVRIRQSFTNWTYLAKTDRPIYGKVFSKDKTKSDPYFSYWFIQQVLTSANYPNTGKSWNQIIQQGTIAAPYPNSFDITKINSFWFDDVINKLERPNSEINITDLKTFFIYMTIYNPIIILPENPIFIFNYLQDKSSIKIEFLYKTNADIKKYISDQIAKYTSYYTEILTVKYPKLVPYFLTINDADQKIENLVNTLIRVLTIMSPIFTIALNINTSNY